MKQKIKYIKLKRKTLQFSKGSKPRSFMAEQGFDKPLLAMLAGTASIIPHIIYTYYLKKLGLIMWDFSQIGASVASNNQITSGWPVYLIGTFQNFVLAGLFGLIFYYSLFLIGKDHILIKGMAFSAIIWMVTRSLFLYFFDIPSKIFSTSFFVLAYYSGMLTWGFLMAFTINKYVLPQETGASKTSSTSFFYVPIPAKKPNRRRQFKKPIKPRKASDF